MKKITYFFLGMVFTACSSEKEQMETIRNIAVNDIIIQLQLPKGTKINPEDISISEPILDAEELGEIFVVTFAIKSQDSDGNFVFNNHVLEYVKIDEGGLASSNYELKSFE